MQRARWRNRDHLKRVAVSDITPEQELAMRKRARKCPLCGIRMTDKPHLPNSKELDHILPVNPLCNGTHTHGNVRIICRKCNQSRPKDGSDFTGQLTLWAQEPNVVSRKRTTCRAGLHPWIPANIVIEGDGKKRCADCRRLAEERRAGYRPPQRCKCGAMFRARGNQFMCPACIDTAAHKAAELHASGLTWAQVAAETGYGSGTGAAYAAERIGYKPPPGLAAAKSAARAKPKPQRLCPACGKPKKKWQRSCEACTTEKAWRAVEMQRDGMTLVEIGDRMGYSSITSVTNLMKTVVTIESRMGRPSNLQRSDLRVSSSSV